MKVLIIVWGTSNRGKSQSIKQLALSFPFSSIIRPWDIDNYDSYVIGAVKDSCGKDRIVGIESLGDPGSYQKEWLGACTKENCEVIVVASRAYLSFMIMRGDIWENFSMMDHKMDRPKRIITF